MAIIATKGATCTQNEHNGYESETMVKDFYAQKFFLKETISIWRKKKMRVGFFILVEG